MFKMTCATQVLVVVDCEELSHKFNKIFAYLKSKYLQYTLCNLPRTLLVVVLFSIFNNFEGKKSNLNQTFNPAGGKLP